MNATPVSKYTLTFEEALKKLMSDKSYIRSTGFKDGLYMKLDKNGLAVVIDSFNLGAEEMNFMLTKTSYNYKWYAFTVANRKNVTIDYTS